jgi:peptidyl-prolyl cis-trans isomerase C
MRRIGSVAVVAALVASSALASKPVLRVNGDEITDVELQMAERAVAMQMPGGKASPEMVLRHAVDQLIGRELVLQAAREAKITVDPKDVQAAIAQQKQQMGGPEAFAKAIAQAGLTEEQLVQFETNRMMLQKYVETDLKSKAGTSDQEVRAYFEAHPEEFKHPEQVKLQMILILVKEGSDQAQKDAAKAKAEAALKRVKGGEDFAKVAGETSEDPGSKPRGGEVGWVRKGMLLPELEPTVWALKAGEVSPVLESKFGYHVFKVEERRPEGTMSFDEVKGSLTEFLRNRKVNDSIRLLIEGRRPTAKIEALDPSLKAALEPLPTPAAGGAAPAAKPQTEKPAPSHTPAADAPKKP